jgi:hypothetical protein
MGPSIFTTRRVSIVGSVGQENENTTDKDFKKKKEHLNTFPFFFFFFPLLYAVSV